MIILEAGINHFGKIKLAKKILNFFLASDFKHLTFMLHTKDFYKKFKKKKIDFELPISFYKEALNLAHKKNKYIGISVCDKETFSNFSDIKFDFYKLLGIAIKNKEVIDILKTKKKNIFISLAKGSNENIKKCINLFNSKKYLNLIYTSMSYENNDLNLSRIIELKERYFLPTGYGHHHNNCLPLYLSSFYKPKFYFVYVKPEFKKGRIYPDNDHAFFFDELKQLKKNLKNTEAILEKKTTKIKIKLDAKKINL